MDTRTVATHSLIGASKSALDTPALLVDLDVMEFNIARIVATCRAHGVAWRPHSKAHKTPEIAQMQIAAGAIGVTCAKLGEAEVMAAAGCASPDSSAGRARRRESPMPRKRSARSSTRSPR